MMDFLTFLRLAWRGAGTLLFQRDKPLVGSLIVTNRCNLSCCHCAVSNQGIMDESFSHVRIDLQTLHDQGCRVVFLYGGEPLLWSDGDATLADVARHARQVGFWLVNVVTNGTRPLSVPDIDLYLVSLDGQREHHNAIRGNTFDQVLANIRHASDASVVLYMAINAINQSDIEAVAELAQSLPNVQAVSYNFHTPYPGTEQLALSREDKLDCSGRITRLIDQGYPILNLRSTLPLIARNEAPVPSKHCLVIEHGNVWECGRCRDLPGLCQQCGFFFAAEYSLLFEGRPRVILDLVQTYGRLRRRKS